MNILLDFLFVIPTIFFFNQNANGAYVPKIYGSVDPQKCLFITENGEEHQVYRQDNVFIFGRVYLLDAHNAKILENSDCHHAEIVENPKMEEEKIEFQKVRIHGKNYSNQKTTMLAKDEDRICRVKNTRGLDYPIYSCQSLMMSLAKKQKVEENLCLSDAFFYLEETFEENGHIRQKVVLLKVPTGHLNKFMEFCGPEIDPVGLSEFIEAKSLMKWLMGGIQSQWRKWHWTKTDMKESEVLEKNLQIATPQQGSIRSWGWGKMEKIMAGNKMLLYHGLSFIVKHFSCSKINSTTDNDDVSSLNLLKAGFQMKLICEDIKGFLVQITKGHLEDGQLSIDDMGKKMAKTVDTLKWSHGLAFDTATAAAEGKQQKHGMKEPKLVDVFKHMQAVVARKLSMFKRNNNNNSPSTSMAEELKPFAGTLLYLLEKMQKNLRKLESSKNGIKQNRRKKRGTKMEMWKKFWEQNRRKKRGTKMEIWKKFWEVVGALIICALIVLTIIVVLLSMQFPPAAAVILSIIITAVLLAAAIGCSQSNNC